MANSQPSSQNTYTIFFMVILSLICAIILSVLASALEEPKELAKELDRSKQMLIAARILNPAGYFQVQEVNGENDKYVPAQATKDGILEPSDEKIFPSEQNVLDVYRTRIQAFLVDDKGNEKTFKETNLQEEPYVAEYRKSGYYKQPNKLIYKIFSNPGKTEKTETNENKEIEGYVFPVNGMGLWDAIYGYLAVKPDGNTVIGISWYDQKETPGLGANISEADWQSQFPGKHLFQESPNGETNFKTAPLGITVVKGKVNEVLGTSPKALSAVDGMAGATLTGNGVTNAYRDVLAAYRPFLLKLQEQSAKQTKE
ncbi:MAG: NADH:ubiquinone reductase (Na(+)-transporting) subunit C [Parachlamydiaceae bacterium]|nr:NADH:ubiquinone reductase (Na(+)-transporting) subunit C [Parachlamydiaceae bacterium]